MPLARLSKPSPFLLYLGLIYCSITVVFAQQAADSDPPGTDNASTSKKLAQGAGPEISIFPADVRYLNVCALGVDNTGTKDCTSALQAAIDSVQNLQFGQRWLYFPKGTYLISDELVSERFITFQGESKEETIIKLADAAQGYADASVSKNLLKVGLSVNESFEVFVNDLTFDAGAGNPGAVALDFQAHNIGAIRNVKFVASEGSGKVGLQLQRNRSERPDWSTPGPMLIQDVEVQGYAVGILTGESTAGLTHVTFERIKTINQRVAGIDVQPRLNISVRDFESVNTGPAIRFGDSFGSTMALMDATMIGGETGVSAIEFDGDSKVYLQNVEASGYQSVVKQGSTVVPGLSFEDWSSDTVTSLFSSPAVTIGLPVEETPSYENTNFDTDWQNVVGGNIQEALDSGKPVVYFQDKGGANFNLFSVTNTITIPSSVRLFHFMGQGVSFTNWIGGDNPIFVIEGTATDPPLIIERMYYQDQQKVEDNVMWLHRGSRTVVFKDARGRYQAEPGAGDVFFEDFVSVEVKLVAGQNAWGRQFNLEDPKNNPDPLITNNGANLWILGYKTEGAKTVISTINGGVTEMIGGNFLPLETKSTDGIPLFVIEDAHFSGAGYQAFYTWNIHVRETRDGVTKELLKEGKVNMALYSGYDPTPLDSSPVGNVTLRARGVSGVEQLEVRHKGEVVGEPLTLSPEFQEYSLSVEDATGTFEVAFINDAIEADGTDRNVQVDYLIVKEDTLQAENQALNTGSWNRELRRCGGVSSEWLHCGGYIAFNVDSNIQRASPSAAKSLISSSEFTVYPNPSHDQVRVSLPSILAGRVQIQLIDLTGKVVREKYFQHQRQTNLSLRHLSPGTYLVKVTNATQQWTQRLMVE